MRRIVFIFKLLLCFSIAHSQHCPDSLYFTSQAQIDSFQILYPNCYEIDGSVYILGNDITNLNGLNNLISIGGMLSISNTSLSDLIGLEGITSIGGLLFVGSNSLMTSLTGLEGLTSVGWYLKIFSNENLSCLSGLQGLTAIGGSLVIDGQYGGNSSLTDLTGLEGLLSIGDKIFILRNDGLTSLSGIDNIDASSILGIYIHHNSSLSNCAVLSVCNYLENPNGVHVISSNYSGCNTPEEVQDSCQSNAVSIDEQNLNNNIFLYPNPTCDNISLFGTEIISFEIIDIKGRILKRQKVTNNHLSYDISNLSKGFCFIRIYTSKGVRVRKLVIH